MNSLERIAATLQFREADRAPVIAQVFAHAAALNGVPIDDYVRDGATLAQCQLRAWKHYGYDAVFSVMDVNVETEAAGSTLLYRKDRYPVVEQYALSGKSDFSALQVPDCRKAGRCGEMLKALSILRRELGNEVLVVGCVMGPFTLATQLLGMEAALYLAIDEPAQLESLMDFATETIVRFGQAQLDAGAHLTVVFDPSASPAVVPPQFFREFELPRLRRVFQALAGSGALASWLHIAGPSSAILPYYPATGANIACFDYCVSAATARDQLPATCLTGNIKPMTFVEGSPADIEADAARLLGDFRDRGGFILSSGCEIPPESAPENVAALVRAACEPGRETCRDFL
jgi:uroporphyrinogen decarboxylase